MDSEAIYLFTMAMSSPLLVRIHEKTTKLKSKNSHQISRRLAGRTNREPISGPMVARVATARDDCVISPNASKGARLTAHWMCQYTERHKNMLGSSSGSTRTCQYTEGHKNSTRRVNQDAQFDDEHMRSHNGNSTHTHSHTHLV